MSAWLRERRADRALQHDYHAMRDQVLRAVRGKLKRDGIHVDDSDLDASYNQAWHGVYGQLLEGVSIENPAGLLVRVTYCRTVDEYRKLHVARRADEQEVAEHGIDPDAAQRLDDEAKLRQFAEGLKDRLSRRECEAATLCYLLGFSRAEAAERLGVEPRRLEKIMDGVSKKVGEFVRDIEAGTWCERRGSLMRAYALGVLDPDGERHVLAREHLKACSGCRAYVRSLRGLGAILPPVGLPLGLAGGLLDALRRLLGGLREVLGAGTAKVAGPMTAKVATGLVVVVAAGAGAMVAARPTPAPVAPSAAATSTPAPPTLSATLAARPIAEGSRSTSTSTEKRRRRAARRSPKAATRPPRTASRRVMAPAITPAPTPSARTATTTATSPIATRPTPSTVAPRTSAPPSGEFSFETSGAP